jgi:hypothetical protein
MNWRYASFSCQLQKSSKNQPGSSGLADTNRAVAVKIFHQLRRDGPRKTGGDGFQHTWLPKRKSGVDHEPQSPYMLKLKYFPATC